MTALDLDGRRLYLCTTLAEGDRLELVRAGAGG